MINGLRETITAESQEWKRDGGGGWELGKRRFPILNLGLPVAQTVKNLPAMLETQVQSLGREDPLEKGMMATQSNILAWRISWTEEPGRLQSMGSQSRIRPSNWAWQRRLPLSFCVLQAADTRVWSFMRFSCSASQQIWRVEWESVNSSPSQHTHPRSCAHTYLGEGKDTAHQLWRSPLSSTYLPTLTSLSLWMRTGHITAPALLCKSGLSEVFLTLLCRNCFLEIWPNLRSHELYVNTSCSKGKGTLNSFIQREIHLLYLVPLQKRPFFPCCLYNNRSVMRVMTCIV